MDAGRRIECQEKDATILMSSKNGAGRLTPGLRCASRHLRARVRPEFKSGWATRLATSWATLAAQDDRPGHGPGHPEEHYASATLRSKGYGHCR